MHRNGLRAAPAAPRPLQPSIHRGPSDEACTPRPRSLSGLPRSRSRLPARPGQACPQGRSPGPGVALLRRLRDSLARPRRPGRRHQPGPDGHRRRPERACARRLDSYWPVSERRSRAVDGIRCPAVDSRVIHSALWRMQETAQKPTASRSVLRGECGKPTGWRWDCGRNRPPSDGKGTARRSPTVSNTSTVRLGFASRGGKLGYASPGFRPPGR